jgi:hypothetical protein
MVISGTYKNSIVVMVFGVIQTIPGIGELYVIKNGPLLE